MLVLLVAVAGGLACGGTLAGSGGIGDTYFPSVGDGGYDGATGE